MSAVLLYDQFDLAASAKISLEHAARRAGEESKWNVRPWRLDLLQEPGMAQDALDDALGADLILLVTSTQWAAPEWLTRWLVRWAACRRVADAALGVLFVSGDGRSAAPALVTQLRDCAGKNGLNFLSNLESRVETGGPLPRSSRRRTAWMRPMLQQIARTVPTMRTAMTNN